MATQVLPPWGQMDQRHLKEIEANPQPKHWTSPNGQSWETWLRGVINVISDKLWPVYVNSASWQTAHVSALFDADFALMPALHTLLREPINAAFPTAVTHLEFFTEEDTDTDLGTGYERYDPSLTTAQRRKLIFAIGFALNDKGSSAHLQMKQHFQRPRAWQVHMIQGRSPRFDYRRANTAFTPALISGHCYQGCVGGCGAFAELGTQLSPPSLEILSQFTVDIGDRRVFSGVHYPSDNLSSWYTVLRLVPTVFDASIAPTVRKFLWEAINRKSLVFKAIREHISANSGRSPFAPIVAEMEKAAEA